MTTASEETFLQRRLRIKAERDALTTPTPAARQVVASVAAGDTRAQRWVDAKITAQLVELAAMAPDSGRNHALNAIAYSLGRYIPKWLNELETADLLYNAARACGLDHAEIGPTIASGLRAGQLEPLDPPTSSDDHSSLTDLVAGPVTTQAPRETPPAPGIDVETGEILTPEQLEQRAHQARVHLELVQLRARHDAKLAHQGELAARDFRAPAYTHTLTLELEIPDEPITYAIDELLPNGGNALLAAAFKTGKTTMLNNLLRAYADGEPFLGRFTVNPGPGRIAIFNYEIDASMNRRWLRQLGIKNTDRVAVLNLRGHRLPLTSPSVEDWVVQWLREQQVTFWIADPFARASTGTDENSNTDVGVWLDTFDVIKARAGVTDAVLATHTGRAEQEHGQERARGATRLDDWADVRWLLTKDDNDIRYFRATGRDVELPEATLTYDNETRALSLGGGDRKWNKNRALSQTVLDFINANPGCGVKQIQVGVTGNKEAIDAARAGLVTRHKARTEPGAKGAQCHYANEVEA